MFDFTSSWSAISAPAELLFDSTTYFHYSGHLPSQPGLGESLLVSSFTCSRRESLGINGMGFHGLNVLKHWMEHKSLTVPATRPCPSFIHHQTPDRWPSIHLFRLSDASTISIASTIHSVYVLLSNIQMPDTNSFSTMIEWTLNCWSCLAHYGNCTLLDHGLERV